jgi:hypothetical protein
MKSFIIITTIFLSISIQAAEKVKHIPGIFLGATKIESETEFTFGLEYEYKLSADWGLGVVYERTSAAHHNDGIDVVLASIYYHTTKNIRLGAGVGEERLGGGHSHEEKLYRISTAYDFHINDFGIAPTIAVDFIDSEKALVFGVAFNKPF